MFLWDILEMFLVFLRHLKLKWTPQILMVEVEYERVARVCNTVNNLI